MDESRSVFREYFEALLIAAVFLGFTNTFVVQTFYIPSGSMEDTLLVGDHLFVNRFIFGPSVTELEKKLLPLRPVERGDIVVFRSKENPTIDVVKRTVGLGGDEIKVAAKELFLDGEQVDDDSYTKNVDPRIFPNRPGLDRQIRQRDTFGPFRVPDEQIFCMGDNRDRSYDSRFWGGLPRHHVKGRALLIYWSNGGDTPTGDESASTRVRQLVGNTLGFFTRTRWRRTFQLIR